MAENPYDPPHADYPEPGRHAPPEPSGIAKTMGVLSIVFASLEALANLWGMASAGMTGQFQPRFGDPEAAEFAQQFARQIMPYSMSIEAMMLVMSIILIVIGAGLVKQRAAARVAAIYWSIAGFVVLAVRTWIFETKIWPRMMPMMHQVMEHAMAKQHANAKDMPFDPMAMAGNMAHGASYIGVVVLAIYPALLLLLLNLPSVKERLRSA
jgi:hypothetical protein